ncbi:MAG: hypothetical protein OIN86_09815 [Candidatus Methanoperedens sp.]|nr:hypothetical protein [Candidatus Methanoperedens sp.]CAG0981821.1 hypothetical protein METP1_01817 [Methanosarcinales archaeon]
MTAEVTISPQKHPVIISFPQQSDYENNKTRIKRIIKTKYKLNKFVYTTGEWYNENDKDQSAVVKRFTDEKGYTNALLFKGNQQLLDDVKALLDSLHIIYEEKEVSEKEVPEQQAPTPPAVSEVPIIEITQEEISKMHKESEDRAYKDYTTRRITAFNAEINGKVRSGLLNDEQANKMKEEFSRKMEIFIHKWSEAGDKWLKEKLNSLRSTKEEAEPEDDFEDLIEKPKDVESIKEKKKGRRKVKR